MAQRTVCLCDGKYVGIETIYTVIDGQQVNIPEKLKELRMKSRKNELFCPCGCGSNLILVAGDKNLREQHFRVKNGDFKRECNMITEGKTSIFSKIVLKCWLDDKLRAVDVEMRVPIQAIDDSNRKYEFSFLSKEKKVAVSYCHERVNLSDEKLGILESNGQGIHIIYIVDIDNGGCNGQYPEGLMKVQNKQGYCLLLDAAEADYSKATMKAVFYAEDIDGLWKEKVFAEGYLSTFLIDDEGDVIFDCETLDSIKVKAEKLFVQEIENEKVKRKEEKKLRDKKIKRLLEENEQKRRAQQKIKEEKEKELQYQKEKAEKFRAEQAEKRRIEEEQIKDEIRRRDEDFKRNMESNFTQQETQVIDGAGNRWIKCEFCGKIGKEDEFTCYGGIGHINLGTCKECSENNPKVKQKIDEDIAKVRMRHDPNVCPMCGGMLCERTGRYGRFIGCSNYPTCKYSRKIK